MAIELRGSDEIHWVTQRRLFGVLPIGPVRPIRNDIHLVAPPSLPLRGRDVVAHVISDSEGGQPLQLLGNLPGQSMPADIRTVYTEGGLQNVYSGDEGRNFVPRVRESFLMEIIGITRIAPLVVRYRL